jgi:hypothetical protein
METIDFILLPFLSRAWRIDMPSSRAIWRGLIPMKEVARTLRMCVSSLAAFLASLAGGRTAGG